MELYLIYKSSENKLRHFPAQPTLLTYLWVYYFIILFHLTLIQIDHLSTSDPGPGQSVLVGRDFLAGIHSSHGACGRKPEKMVPLSSESLPH